MGDAEDIPLLRTLLFGDPVTARLNGVDTSLSCTPHVLMRAVKTLEREVGCGAVCDQVHIEWERLIAETNAGTLAGAQALRAGLLFCLSQDPATCAFFAKREPLLVRDLQERILPMLIPRFVATMAQTPDTLVSLACVMHIMWDDVPIGMETEART